MRKKMYQIVSFVMTCILIISSMDMSVLAVESPVAEEPITDEIILEDEREGFSDEEKSENSENSSAETVESEEDYESNKETEFIRTEEIITTETENETIEQTEVDDTEDETSTETNSEKNTEPEISSENLEEELIISDLDSENKNVISSVKITVEDLYNNSSLDDLLYSYFGLLAYGFTEFSDEELYICMNQDVFKELIRRFNYLNEKNKTIDSVTYEVTEYEKNSNNLLVSVAETVGNKIINTVHTLTISGNDKSGWRIESDFYDDTDISGIRTDGKEISLYAFSNDYPNTWVNTGDQAKNIAQIALTQVGYTETDNHTKYNNWYYGYDKADPWCAIFVSWCANQAGIPKTIITPSAWAGAGKNRFGVPEYSFSSTTAKIGDLAFINNDSDSDSDHVGLVYAVDSNWIYTVEGNASHKVCTRKYSTSTGRMANASKVNILYYGRPNYSNNSTKNISPIGDLNEIKGGKGTITAIGWAADPDNYSKDVDIHIYVGGNIGVGSLYAVTANNESRSDVKNKYPNVKENCGFNYTFKVNERGTQEVYVYALDTQGSSTNTLIGHATITIANPDPTIRIEPSSLQLNKNDTKALTIHYQIDGTYALNYHIADANIISAKWGTPDSANNTCDLNIKGLKKGSTSIDVQLLDETATTLIYKETIPITVTELSVDYSDDIVETNENETKTFQFCFSGSDLYGLECDIGDRSIADLTGWEWNADNYGTISVQGYKEGSTNLTVHLIGINNTVLFSQSVPITVTKPSVNFGQNSMDVSVNETKEISFSFKGSNLMDIGLDIGDQSIASLEGWSWNADNNGTIKIKGHKKGATIMTLYLIGADDSRICSKSIPISVKNSLSGIALNILSKELTAGSSFQLTASYIPFDAVPKGTVQWSSSNTGIATVDAHGRVKAIKAGNAVITASVDGFSKECQITVIEKQSTSIPEESTEHLETEEEASKSEESSIEKSSTIESAEEKETATEGVSESAANTESSEEKEDSSKQEEESSEQNEEASKQEEESSEQNEEASKQEEESSEQNEEASKQEEESSEQNEGTTDKISIKPIADMVYTGTAVKPELEVYNGSKKLLLNKDYTISYKNNIGAGTAYAIVKGKGNYSDKATSSFRILPKDLSDPDVIAEDLALVANHKVQKKIPTVSYNGKKLKVNKDFTASFGKGDFKEEGIYTVTLTGIKNYTGSVETKIILTDKKNLIKNAKVTYQSKHSYTGKAIMPAITVMSNNNLLANSKDYTVSYINNIEPGKAAIVITGKGQYAGTKLVNFTITKTRTVLAEQMVTVTSSMPYVKGGCFPEPIVVCSGKTLVLGSDYTVSYKNNKSVGMAAVMIKGKGEYSGTVEKSFMIQQKNINNISVRVPDIAYDERTGKYISTPILIDSDGNMLKQNTDYGNVAYSVNGTQLNKQSKSALGSAITVTLSGMGSYMGTVTRTYELKKISFSKAKASVAEKTYTGTAVTINPSDLHVTLNGETLVYGKDYDIVKGTYKNNTKKGQASVVIKGLGEFAGEKTVKFRILAKPIN